MLGVTVKVGDAVALLVAIRITDIEVVTAAEDVALEFRCLAALDAVDADAVVVAASSLTRCELAVIVDAVSIVPDDSLTLEPFPVDNTAVEDVP
jgi:hypothetical protein